MKDPLYLTLFHPGEGFEDRDPLVMSTPIPLATPDHQAQHQNELCRHGQTETLLAHTPQFWQRKLARALLFGMAAGAIVTIGITVIIQ